MSAPESSSDTRRTNLLVARRLGIDTHQEPVVFMHTACRICRSEGFDALARIRLEANGNAIIATVFKVSSEIVMPGEAGLSESAWQRLSLREGDRLHVRHAQPLVSLSDVRAKIFGHHLDRQALKGIIDDVVAGRYADLQVASFVTACSAQPLEDEEIVDLTWAMAKSGEQLVWSTSPIVDKHSVGGLPGNRTTPIIVAIAAAYGLVMPKTSSRAITSPAGTADMMETLAPVDLDVAAMRRVVECEGGCIVWGGSMQLSPADDILIRVERALDLDPEGQLVASVLSKKIAAGSTDLVLDMPVGPTAKVRNSKVARLLATRLVRVAEVFGLRARVVMGDGCQPIGHGIGPALEAHDVLKVLRGDTGAPTDLRDRALLLSAAIIEMAAGLSADAAAVVVREILDDGRAWSKFQAICEAQGGLRQPPTALHRFPVVAKQQGCVSKIDNRRLGRVAKLAGAPSAHAAGIESHVRLGDIVDVGEPIYTIHAESPGELEYALDFVTSGPSAVELT